ncbi:palmdelphin-like [Eucyclogobius newberryi]|uniref:palmdelphin-like n=1 Tax=Eucyclogobius newberryi TaxID=166745 RepID=UPI003B5C8649
MEEETLLKERLQAITDKKRIREDISRKRRDIEEEKLKLQYIKKKSLREQWLMDGLQSEEEREAMKIQAQDELQRTTQLQSNILGMEKEMEELEAQELELSANEEAILKRLKEVERTTEDIIKVTSSLSRVKCSPSQIWVKCTTITQPGQIYSITNLGQM